MTSEATLFLAQAFDPEAAPHIAVPTQSDFQQALDNRLRRMLSHCVEDQDSLAIVYDCAMLASHCGQAAWCRIRHNYNPRGMTFTANQMLALLGMYQQAQTASEHVAKMDRAVTAALRPFLRMHGGYDWEGFAKFMLATIYFASFSEDVQDLLRPGLKSLKQDEMTHGKIRADALADENINKLGRQSAPAKQQLALYAGGQRGRARSTSSRGGYQNLRSAPGPSGQRGYVPSGGQLQQRGQHAAPTGGVFKRPGKQWPCPNCGAPNNGKPHHRKENCPEQCTIPFCKQMPGKPHVQGCPRGPAPADASAHSAETMHDSPCLLDPPATAIDVDTPEPTTEQQYAHLTAVLDNCAEQRAYLTKCLDNTALTDDDRVRYERTLAEVDLQATELRAGQTRLAGDVALGVSGTSASPSLGMDADRASTSSCARAHAAPKAAAKCDSDRPACNQSSGSPASNPYALAQEQRGFERGFEVVDESEML